jgi:hypothetical protein
MIERFAAFARGADEHVEIGARLFLADEFVELLRTQMGLGGVFLAPFGRNHAAWRAHESLIRYPDYTCSGAIR